MRLFSSLGMVGSNSSFESVGEGSSWPCVSPYIAFCIVPKESRRSGDEPMEPWLPCPDKASSLLVGLTGFPPLQLILFPSLINPSARNQALFICLKKTEKDGVGSDTDDCFLNPRLLECFTQRSALSTGFITLINSEPAQVVWFLQERVVA